MINRVQRELVAAVSALPRPVWRGEIVHLLGAVEHSRLADLGQQTGVVS